MNDELYKLCLYKRINKTKMKFKVFYEDSDGNILKESFKGEYKICKNTGYQLIEDNQYQVLVNCNSKLTEEQLSWLLETFEIDYNWVKYTNNIGE